MNYHDLCAKWVSLHYTWSRFIWILILRTVKQEESDSERESNEALTSEKPLKRKRGKVQPSVSKDPCQSRSIASSDGYLSFLKRRRFDGIIWLHCYLILVGILLAFYYASYPCYICWRCFMLGLCYCLHYINNVVYLYGEWKVKWDMHSKIL